MVLLDDLPKRLQADDPEERHIITGVSWEHYEALLADLGDSLAYRVAYLDGVLEIVSPSRRHETAKTRTGDLLLIYFLETDTEYFPMGSTTLRKPEKRAGGEPDESYCIRIDKEFPDLAIEVIVTSGGINRLELFRRLGIREVWFWEDNHFLLYALREEPPVQLVQTWDYERIDRSEVLPDLDLDLLTECVRNPNPLAAAKQFQQRLREQLEQQKRIT
jgi:Uma2 family endonuclease